MFHIINNNNNNNNMSNMSDFNSKKSKNKNKRKSENKKSYCCSLTVFEMNRITNCFKPLLFLITVSVAVGFLGYTLSTKAHGLFGLSVTVVILKALQLLCSLLTRVIIPKVRRCNIREYGLDPTGISTIIQNIQR